jgi:hypothetical protein
MKRRTFLTGLGTGLVAAPLLLKVTGCDDGGGDVTSSGGTTGGDGDNEPGFRVENSDAATSHPHSFVVLCADDGMDEVTYTAGGSGHNHSITLSGAELETIFGGGSVTKNTEDGGHPHTWVVALPDEGCSEPPDPPTDLDTTTGGW